MKGGHFLRIYSALAIACLLALPGGCSKTDRSGETTSAAEKVEPAQKKDIVFTQNQPGPWSGKEDAHVPKISYQETLQGEQIKVFVNHEMNAEIPHFIMWIQIKDGEGRLLGEKTFQDSDAKAEAIFTVSSLPDKLMAYSRCNLHGLWANDSVIENERSN